MSRIDVHMLLLGNEREDWKAAAVASVPPSICTLRFADGIAGHIGRARQRAYALGDADYVSYVDPDDWLESDTFERCLAYLDRHRRCAGVVTHEMVHDEFRGRVYETRDKHGLAVFRREWLNANLHRLESPAAVDIRLTLRPEIVLLPFVGRHWRKYESAGWGLRGLTPLLP